jgi:hypothetical protein
MEKKTAKSTSSETPTVSPIQATKDIKRKCIMCGNHFSLSPELVDRYKKAGYILPVRCKNCNDLKLDGEPLICKSCGATFIFNKLREKQLRDKYGDNYRKPVFCSSCQKAFRQQQENNSKK